MDALLRIVVQYLHVFSGILWIGGGFYTIVVQLPAVLAMPQAARGPAMAQLVPRQWKYIFRVAELTIFWGFVNVFVSGRAQQLLTLDSRWAWSIIVGAVLALAIYILLRARLAPFAYRVLELGPKAASGDASAAAERPRSSAGSAGSATSSSAWGSSSSSR